jgi:glycerophosphoryl diester phosphodiesterase
VRGPLVLDEGNSYHEFAWRTAFGFPPANEISKGAARCGRGRSSIGSPAVILPTCLFILALFYYGVQAIFRSRPVAPLRIAAHRGGRAYAPENTLAAFKDAIAQGVDAIEFDVQMTKDGELVVIHDTTVDRTTNGTGAVRDLTLAKIRALDAGDGQQVPTLDEVLQLARAAGMPVFAETKAAHLYSGVEEKLVNTLEQAGLVEAAVVQSFERASLDRLHDLNPNLMLCALYGPGQFNVRAPGGDAGVVCPMGEMVLLRPDMIRRAHAEGREIFVWFGVLENPWIERAMRYFGVDGFIVDDPPAARAAIGG